MYIEGKNGAVKEEERQKTHREFVKDFVVFFPLFNRPAPRDVPPNP
jgi:hypothetical protein